MSSSGHTMAVTAMSSQHLGFPAQDPATQNLAEEIDNFQDPHLFREQLELDSFQRRKNYSFFEDLTNDRCAVFLWMNTWEALTGLSRLLKQNKA